MRTGKQTLTAVVTLIVLFSTFLVYVQTFGRLTDFEQIDPTLLVPMADDVVAEVDERTHRESEIAALRGFGPACRELHAPLIFEFRKKTGPDAMAGRGLGMFVYAQKYDIDKQNPKLMRLYPFSLAYITRTGAGERERDEIDTVIGKEAWLEFDRPIELTRASSARPIAGWVVGDVQLKSNRRTPAPEDDITMHTERLEWGENKNLIWATDEIKIVSHDLSVTGSGLELELYPKPKPGEPKVKRKAEAKSVRLLQQVRFDLAIDSNADFLGGADAGPKTDDNSKAQTTPVTVTAHGPFVFDPETNRAEFQKSVQVLRHNPPKKPGDKPTTDQLVCDELQLQFRPKDESRGEQPSDSASTGGNLKLQTATARGREVFLRSDSQGLNATGAYLFHDADARRAILQGEREMIAVHENTYIHARTLILEQGENRGVRNLVADGPNGWLEVLEKDGERKGAQQLKICWQGRLTLSPQPDSETRLAHITDDVELELPGEELALQSDELKVWLDPIKDAAKPTTTASTSVGDPARSMKLEPSRLEATKDVSAGSPELTVVTDKLVMIIERKPEEPAPKPSVAPAARPADAGPRRKPGKGLATARPLEPKPSSTPAPAPPAPKQDRPKEPLDVRARLVTVTVERRGKRSQPTSARAEGDVLVTQTPAKGEKDSLEVRGQLLIFQRTGDGDILEVEGAQPRLAEVKTPEMVLVGRAIQMDEVRNRVDIGGAGYLLLESDNDITGKKTDARARPLRIEWSKSMNFDGKFAYFAGDVRAQQEYTEILCQIMDVAFAKRVVFREERQKRRERDKERVTVETVDCDKDVFVQDYEVEGEILQRVTLLKALELHYFNNDRTFTAMGPGMVRVIERKKPELDANGSKVPPKHPFELTEITFQERMAGNNNDQTVKFHTGVRIVHVPGQDWRQVPDEENLPPDGMAISSQRAEMASTDLANGEKQRDFRAEGNVKVHAREYWGHCDQLGYSQHKDMLVFESLGNNRVRFYRETRPGLKPTETSARQVRYFRKTGEVIGSDTGGFDFLEVQPTGSAGRRR